jgi:hypothetical protein
MRIRWAWWSVCRGMVLVAMERLLPGRVSGTAEDIGARDVGLGRSTALVDEPTEHVDPFDLPGDLVRRAVLGWWDRDVEAVAAVRAGRVVVLEVGGEHPL